MGVHNHELPFSLPFDYKAGMADRHSHSSPHATPPANHDATAVRELSDGDEDDLVPLKSLDPLAIHSFDDLVRAMGQTAFSGRALGEACDVLEAMARDKD